MLPPGEPRERQKLIDTGLIFSRRHAIHAGMKEKIFPGREVAIEIIRLWYHPYATAHLLAGCGYAVSLHKRISGGGARKSSQNFYEGCFSCTVRAEEAEDTPRLN